ncbi:hypothetical protein SDRG_14690 [Saprolegnia diclina VS20]|uniref:RUS1 family protein n=1 Tax=Saprolegnia diclina (strain VS20) TaxID=1156394 RepID=T0RD54_SAPDV|nr:hypothetical protein SDRG_14690 [Saprolegnia diclina VS20]EQC27487.1 hypothetical protein SDRG_14690 [Saprolegnia diclina VS20]|eukprot:XP_008619061.1 hypothetical protein SDRG_14690 [Saprolegnia diclina VS20]
MERKAKQRGARADEANAPISVVEYDVRSSRAHAPPLAQIWRATDGRLVADATLSTSPPRSRPTWLLQAIRSELFDMFLPAGYPHSVTEDYLPFQLWDTCQAMCSYLRGVLATQSVLESVGVGNEAITPLAAALQWVMRDGSGMLGGLFFAYGVGPKFDANVKFWRLYADVINDVGLTLDMLAPFAPRCVTQILCVSSVCKAMCGVAAGATRSSLTAHFAKTDNMADIAAKEGSQETFVTLLGLLTGMYFANVVNQSRASVWVAFLLLTAIHVVANYKAVTSLCIPTLNQARATLAIRSFRGSQTQRLSIARVNAMEPILPRRDGPRILLGGRLPPSLDLPSLLALHKDDHYVLTVDAASSTVVASLFVSATPMDELKAYFNAVVVADAGAPAALSVLATAHATTTTEFSAFVETMESLGWTMHASSFPLSTQPTRYAIARN